MLAVLVLSPTADAAAALSTTTSLTTGTTHACAVTGGVAKCWGKGQFGALGNDSDWDSSKPVAVVSKAAWKEPVKVCDKSEWFQCTKSHIEQVPHPAEGLGGKAVVKISAGTDHTCAIASAKVYCWGHADNGRLGNGDGIGWKTTPVAVKADKTSALYKKEVIDISAGDSFTCALASDGTVVCWGMGANGRLGTGNTDDKYIPVAVSTGNGSALAGKKGIRLAKVTGTTVGSVTSGATMCALTIPATSTVTTIAGVTVCWGYGIDDGTALPAGTSSDTTCGKSSPTGRPSDTSDTTIFSSTKPVAVPGATLSAIDGQDYITGLGTNKQTYYWGMYGYRQDATYANVKSCTVDCHGKVSFYEEREPRVQLAGTVISRETANIRLAMRVTGRKVTDKTGKTVSQSGNMTGRSNSSTNTLTKETTTTYLAKSCHDTTHYGFTKTTTNANIGQKVATLAPTTSITSGVSTISGNAYSGLYCAVKATAVSCDGHGTDTTYGQLGNGQPSKDNKNTPQLSGPQTVTSTGWLSGKQVTQLSTSSTGYTCAIASGSVGCWGVNRNGVLGVNSGDWWKTVSQRG